MEKKIWNTGDTRCLVEMPAFLRDGFHKDRHFIQIELGMLADELQKKSLHDELNATLLPFLTNDLKLEHGVDFKITLTKSGRHVINLIARQVAKQKGFINKLVESLTGNSQSDISGVTKSEHTDIVDVIVNLLSQHLAEYLKPKLFPPNVSLKAIKIFSGSDHNKYFAELLRGNKQKDIDRFYRDKIIDGTRGIPRFIVDPNFSANIISDDRNELRCEFSLVDTTPSEIVKTEPLDAKPETKKPSEKPAPSDKPVLPSPPSYGKQPISASASVAIYYGKKKLTTINVDSSLGVTHFGNEDAEGKLLSDPQFKLFKHNNIWMIEHLAGAKNQTYVDGVILNSYRESCDGMRITLGNKMEDKGKFPLIVKAG